MGMFSHQSHAVHVCRPLPYIVTGQQGSPYCKCRTPTPVTLHFSISSPPLVVTGAEILVSVPCLGPSNSFLLSHLPREGGEQCGQAGRLAGKSQICLTLKRLPSALDNFGLILDWIFRCRFKTASCSKDYTFLCYISI